MSRVGSPDLVSQAGRLRPLLEGAVATVDEEPGPRSGSRFEVKTSSRPSPLKSSTMQPPALFGPGIEPHPRGDVREPADVDLSSGTAPAG